MRENMDHLLNRCLFDVTASIDINIHTTVVATKDYRWWSGSSLLPSPLHPPLSPRLPTAAAPRGTSCRSSGARGSTSSRRGRASAWRGPRPRRSRPAAQSRPAPRRGPAHARRRPSSASNPVCVSVFTRVFVEAYMKPPSSQPTRCWTSRAEIKQDKTRDSDSYHPLLLPSLPCARRP